MLSKSYRQKRPKSRTSMGERLSYLRSIRAGRLQTDPHATPPGREITKDCAVLLKANPGGPKSTAQARDTSGEPEDLDSPASPTDRRPDTASTSSHRSLDTAGEPRTSLESDDPEAKDPSPDMFRNPWSSSSSYQEIRCDKADFLRDRCPSRSSSFLADVASLLSGLSIRSSLSRSSSGSSRRSVRSCSSRAEPSSSGVRGDWEAAAERPLPPTDWSTTTTTTAPSNLPSSSSSTSPHTLENLALVQSCCSQPPPSPHHRCIHQRITAILTHPQPTTTTPPFTCTPAEANTTDALGNTTLHVAARWGAPGPVLFHILTLSIHPGATNQRGETFLHVLDPAALAPGDLAQIVQYLAAGGGVEFDFGRVDGSGQSFVGRLMARGGGFSLEGLEAVFCHLPEGVRVAFLGGGGGGRGVVEGIRARLVVGDSAEAVEAAEAYCRYFVARYGTPAAVP